MMTETDFENNLFWNKYKVEGKKEEHHEFSDYERCRAIDEMRRMEQRQNERKRKEMQEAEQKRQKERERKVQEQQKMELAYEEAKNALKQCIESLTLNYEMVEKKRKGLSDIAQVYFHVLLPKVEAYLLLQRMKAQRDIANIVEFFDEKQKDVNRHFDI